MPAANRFWARPHVSVHPILCLALAVFVVPVHAGTLAGSFGGNATLTPTGSPGIFMQNLSFGGTDENFGAFAGSSQSTVDFSQPPQISVSNGMLSQSFAQLGSLFGTTTGSGIADGHGGATFTADFVITGGTGIFTNAVGEATVTGTITRTSPTTDTVDASYRGSFTVVPEPSTVALLVAGIAGLGLGWRRRQRDISARRVAG